MSKSLAETLKEIRKIKGLTLREVEDATGVSNAYLSQLENGDAAKPSPDKLHSLAEFYEVPYEELMRVAGYLQKTASSTAEPSESVSAVQSALMSAKLSADEEEQVIKFVQFLRYQNKK